MPLPPRFLLSSPIPARAFALAAWAHRGQTRKGDGTAYLEHPVEVARILREEGGVHDEEMLAAALLHDVVEDTDVALEEIEEELGGRVAELVAAMSEDKSIDGYERRKGSHLERVRSGGADAALLFAADKVANMRSLRAEYARHGEALGERFNATLDVKVGHTEEQVEVLCEVLGEDAPLAVALADELRAFRLERRGG